MAKFKFDWGHGLALALASFIIFILSLIFFAGDMGEMVDENYYEKTVQYQDEINAANRANSLAKKPEIILQANGYLIRFYEDVPESGSIRFLRSNDSGQDVSEPLNLNSQKEQLIHAVNLKDGDYEVTLRWKQNNQDYLIKKTVNWKDPSL